jgi:fatty acid desaturase
LTLDLDCDLLDDLDVQRGDFSKALISWLVFLLLLPPGGADAILTRYFTLAHEIAHNLVHQHNSVHEFYFSAICEAYLVPLAKLLPGS